MAKTLNHTITYPKPVAAAWSDITNPAYQQGRLADCGATNIEVTIDKADDGSAKLVLERDNPAAGVPSAVKKVIGETAHVIERVNWSAPGADGGREAELITEFIGAPLSMHGTLTLVPAADTTDLVLKATFKSSIPLVGGKFEDTGVKETVKTLDAEQAFSAGFTG
jgi:hypothetical protein